jgi:hypothetical protein
MKLETYFSWVLGESEHIAEAVVLGPYLSSQFFSDLQRVAGRRITKETRITVLADDGWDDSELSNIQRLFESRVGCTPVTYQVRATLARGLVHAKLYYFKTRNMRSRRTKQILLLGSANASVQGFGTHAEAFAHVDLADISMQERRQLLEYVRRLQEGLDVEEMSFYLSGKSWVLLPSVNRVSGDEEGGFDSWLRRGMLCHDYRPDPRFGKLELKLKRALPPGSYGRAVRRWRAPESSGLYSLPYTSTGDIDDARGSKPRWKNKFFVETYYGFWTSRECYKERRGEFVLSTKGERHKALKEIAGASPDQHRRWIAEFERAVEDAFESVRQISLAERGPSVDTFFCMSNRHVDMELYRNVAKRKLHQDQVRAKDVTFAERFVRGCTFPKVPQMDDHFDEFAVDFCDTLLLKLTAPKMTSRIARQVAQALSTLKLDFPEDSEELLKTLRAKWSRISPFLLNYHAD